MAVVELVCASHVCGRRDHAVESALASCRIQDALEDSCIEDIHLVEMDA